MHLLKCSLRARWVCMSCQHRPGKGGALSHTALSEMSGMEVQLHKPRSCFLGESGQKTCMEGGVPTNSTSQHLIKRYKCSFFCWYLAGIRQELPQNLSLVRSLFSKSLARRSRLLEIFFFSAHLSVVPDWRLLQCPIWDMWEAVRKSRKLTICCSANLEVPRQSTFFFPYFRDFLYLLCYVQAILV